MTLPRPGLSLSLLVGQLSRHGRSGRLPARPDLVGATAAALKGGDPHAAQGQDCWTAVRRQLRPHDRARSAVHRRRSSVGLLQPPLAGGRLARASSREQGAGEGGERSAGAPFAFPPTPWRLARGARAASSGVPRCLVGQENASQALLEARFMSTGPRSRLEGAGRPERGPPPLAGRPQASRDTNQAIGLP